MPTILHFLFAALFLTLIAQGYCECTIDSITISQIQTGKTVENKPEFRVTINNNCACVQSDLKLSCDGFQTVEVVDSSVMSKSGGECLIKGGQPIAPFSSDLSFNYAWDTSFPFEPLSSQVSCS